MMTHKKCKRCERYERCERWDVWGKVHREGLRVRFIGEGHPMNNVGVMHPDGSPEGLHSVDRTS